VRLSFYTPLQLDDAVARSALGEGPQAMESEREFGMSVYSTRFDLGAGQTVTLELRLSGVIEPGDDYRLTVANQPTVNPDTMTVTVTPGAGYTALAADGFEAGEDGAAVSTVDTTEGDLRVRVPLEP
jgi:hypothetical protein